MRETEKISFDIMPPRIRGSFLTKEQVEKLKEPFKNVVSVIRCKDCRHHGKGTCSAAAGIAYPPPDDWFCADGEQK